MANIGFDYKAFLSFLVLILFVGVVFGGVIAVRNFSQLNTKASLSSKPTSLLIVNLTDESATFFWQTEAPTRGFISYGTSQDLGKTRLDDRDVAQGQPAQYRNHIVTLHNLSPKTKYYYTIGSDSDIYDRDGFPYTFFTGPNGAQNQTPAVLQARLLTLEKLPAEDYFVTLTFESQSNGKLSNLVGGIAESGGLYTIPLSALLTNDGQAAFPLLPQDTYTVEATLYSTEGLSDTQTFIYAPSDPFPTLSFQRSPDNPNGNFPTVGSPIATPRFSTNIQNSLLVPQTPIATGSATPSATLLTPPTPTPKPTSKPSLRLLL